MIDEILKRANLLALDDFSPFPPSADRGPWQTLPAGLRNSLVAAGEKYLGYAWPPVRATDYLEYVESGDRSRHAARYFDRRFAVGSLAVAECVEGSGRFLRDLVDGLWLICEETSWVIPAHESDASSYPGPLPSWRSEEQGIDLFAAETGALLAWVRYLLARELGDRYPAVFERLRHEVKGRIIRQFLDRDDQWWMGLEPTRHHYLNNWTPWCVSNCIAAILLVEEDDETRRAGFEKAAGCLDRYLSGQPEDGGCDEGPGYWMAAAGALCDALELLALGTGGAANAFQEPLVREMAAFLHRVHIGGTWFVNFGDGNAKLSPPPELLYRFGKRVGDPELVDLGLDCHSLEAATPTRWYPMLRQLSLLFSFVEMSGEKAARTEKTRPTVGARSKHDRWFGEVRVTWLPDSEIFVCSGNEFFLAAKGAHNGESHNHNDVGQFVLYAGGEPFIIDAGVAEYTKKTFSDERYDIWTMQSGYHNLPSIAGFDQLPGSEYRAKNCSEVSEPVSHVFELELQDAYPTEAGIARWHRRFEYRSGDDSEVLLSESCEFAESAGEVVMHLMTPWEPRTDAGDSESVGHILLSAPSGTAIGISFSRDFEVDWEKIVLDDSRLSAAWGEALYRISYRVAPEKRSGDWQFRFTLEKA